MTTLVWFRDDLRVADNPALVQASSDPDGVVCLYLLDEVSAGVRALGGASKWWLHHSLVSLTRSLQTLGVTLVLRHGSALDVVPEIAREVGATRVLWNRRYGGAERRIDTELKAGFTDNDIEARSFAASLLHEPWSIATRTGTPYRVYTPFWRACQEAPSPRLPLAPPEALAPAADQPHSDELEAWGLLPTSPNWAAGIAETWTPGEAAAGARLAAFLDDDADRYQAARDFPAQQHTSRLAPHLRWGEISPHTVWHAALTSGRDVGMFLSELGWREFAWHTLYHRPDLAETNLDVRFDEFPWAENTDNNLEAWQQGKTGYPLVDAGMRELWHTGTMHNRVRMVTASFLVKNLLIDWRAGEQWFWETLVDADQASNPFNWQWVAGCGADAAPYFRIFNPVTQQKKFDPDGEYCSRWGALGAGSGGGVVEPIVDLKATRNRALDAFAHIKSVHR